MSSVKQAVVSNLLRLALLGLPLAACEGPDADGAAGAPEQPGAASPVPAGEREVTSVVIDHDGQVHTTEVRMTEAQWQAVLAQREAGGSGTAALRENGPLAKIQQAATLSTACSDSAASLFFSDIGLTGKYVVCLRNDGYDGTASNMSLPLNFTIRSYRTGHTAVTA